jgi:outer membrane protein TolC
VLSEQEKVQRAAVAAARQAEALSLNQYRLGTVPYTTVVQTQATALSAEQTLLTIRLNRLTASANLVLALGGGWRDSDLPRPIRSAAQPEAAAAHADAAEPRAEKPWWQFWSRS